MSNVYLEEKKCLAALEFYQKPLTIDENYLPSDHSELGKSRTHALAMFIIVSVSMISH